MMNPRQKKIATICCIGCVILAWRIYAIVTKYMPSPAEAAPADVLPAAAPAAPVQASPWIDVPDQILELQDSITRQAWGRDPFAFTSAQIKVKEPPPELITPEKPQKMPPEIKFNGVSKSGSQWLAAINGVIYRVGDQIDADFRIIAIERNSVTLACDGWAFEFALGAQKPKVRRIGERP